MNNILLISNRTRDKNYLFTKKLIKFLKEKDKKVFATEKDMVVLGAKLVEEKSMDKMDMSIVIGGDGTIIHASKLLSAHEIPVVGINLGNLGFLAEIEVSNFEDSLNQIFKGVYTTIDRTMLEATVYRSDNKKPIYSACCLNDIVIARVALSRMVGYRVYVNEVFVNDYNADGVIISTSTGSTAYNLSAGGPILSPGSNTIVITPICPHSLAARSIVLNAADTVKIDFENNRKNWEQGIMITADGDDGVELKSNQFIEIKKSDKSTKLISLKNHDFYKSLRSKLKTY